LVPPLGISAENLEEIEYINGGFAAHRSDMGWADDEIFDMVEEFNAKDQMTEVTAPNDLRDRLIEDVALLAQECPNVKSLDISLFGDQIYLHPEDDIIWVPFVSRLLMLQSLTLIGHRWSESVALVKSIGIRLKKLYLALRDRHAWDMPNLPPGLIPKLDKLLDICPNLEILTLSFGTLTVHVSNEVDNQIRFKPLLGLTQITVHTYMTKKAFMYLWARAHNLEMICIVNELVVTEGFPHDDQAEFTEADIYKMFRNNKMSGMKNFSVSMRLKSIGKF
jgi:hypothetical protein